ncbi:hypothetical protein GWK47_030690 [Chionoecetes opilio]|uniref:Uncharacterized protein n=1 Tax=Chionoecetes opilio TaxID=41210 RepID=A0A8J4YLG0_CHIOP|nr:hypothetical protein GWK47_030690 [Chionoecetes opilio]
MFCAKKGQIESGQLPPCEDSLMQHTLRANIRRLSGDAALKTCQTSQHHQQDMAGEIDDGGSLKIRWMAGLPAPDVILNLISSHAEGRVDRQIALHTEWGLKCTVVCKLQGCSNMVGG